MKRFISFSALLFTLSILGVFFTSFTNQNNALVNYNYLHTYHTNYDTSLLPISNDERVSLLRMREEEKMARDVYQTLNIKYNSMIFSNIARSEQMHTNTILQLLNKYAIQDPVGNNAVGVFSDTHYQSLYNSLIAKGNVSIQEAFQVGATVEDLDMYDLKTDLLKVEKQDIKSAYELLSLGTRNHMRAFNRNIKNSGGSYTTQYISQVNWDTIVNSAMERGF